MYFYGANGSVCAQVRILNDVLIENTESFTVSVGISDTDFTFVGSDTSTVEITNDDSECEEILTLVFINFNVCMEFIANVFNPLLIFKWLIG